MPPNPYDNPSYFNQVIFGGVAVPGTIGDIRGLKSREEWTTVKPIAGTGASKIHKSRPPIENIEIDYSINGYTEADDKAILALHSKFILHMRGSAKIYSKPRAMEVVNTSFKDVFVRQIVYKGHDAPVWRVSKWFATVIVDEYQKAKIAPVGPPEPAILSTTDPVAFTEGEKALERVGGEVWNIQSPADKAPTGAELSAMYPGSNGAL